MVIVSVALHAQKAQFPLWVLNSFKKLKLDDKYDIKGYLKPVFLQSDFNGDGVTDAVFQVIETLKKGIVILFGNSSRYFVFGAGTNFGNGSDDFKWAGGWKIYNKKTAYETMVNIDGDLIGSKIRKLKRTAFFIYQLEDGEPVSGGIIYWNGKKYIWIQQGD